MAGKPKHPLVLTGDERTILQGWATRRKTAQGLALRARMVLLCAGWPLQHGGGRPGRALPGDRGALAVTVPPGSPAGVV
jgi:hypothetical protein